jgi:hypothetical protein
VRCSNPKVEAYSAMICVMLSMECFRRSVDAT